MTQGERPKWQLYKIWNEEIDTNRTSFELANLHERKDGLSD